MRSADRRCHDPAVVPAAAVRLGVSGRTSPSQNHRRQCQASAVRRHQPPYGAPIGLPASGPPTTGRLPCVPAGPASTLRRPTALAVAGPGLHPHRRARLATGPRVGRDSLVAAQAVPGVELAGSSMEGVETSDCCQPSVRYHRRRSGPCRTLAAGAVPPQPRHFARQAPDPTTSGSRMSCENLWLPT